MLSHSMLTTYKDLKRKKDAAYKVFKQDPTVINASKHAAATQAFTNFCISSMAELAGDVETENKDHILEHIEDYKTCKICGSEILYQVDEGHYIGSSDFVPEFPGWCYVCLVEHCLETNCESCNLVTDNAACPYKEVKKIYQED